MGTIDAAVQHRARVEDVNNSLRMEKPIPTGCQDSRGDLREGEGEGEGEGERERGGRETERDEIG